MTAKLSEHDSTPPKPYTEDTLLSAMERAGNEDITEEAERKGLGTPATRAAEVMGLEIAIADELLAEALQTLPQDRLEIVLLSYFLGMSDLEIADQLNLCAPDGSLPPDKPLYRHLKNLWRDKLMNKSMMKKQSKTAVRAYFLPCNCGGCFRQRGRYQQSLEAL